MFKQPDVVSRNNSYLCLIDAELSVNQKHSEQT